MAAEQGGYLPACGELKAVIDNRSTVNNTLSAISGTQISDNWFWSSSEYSCNYAWYVYGNGYVTSINYKRPNGIARAVVALSTVYLFNNLKISCEAEAEQTITVHPVFDMPTVVDTVCFAENYTEYGWSINTADSIADTYLYERKEQTIHGCDSIVNLQLTIIPEVIVNPTYDITVCNGASISTTFTTSTIGNGTMTYAWTNDNTSIGLAASGEGDIASFPATNTGTAPDTAVIVVTPNYILGTVPCVGDADTFMIIVNPTAVVNAIDNQTLCNGSNTDAVIFGTTNTGGTMRYTWTNDTPSIGLAASGEGDIASFAAANTGTAPVTATITVTPYFTYNGVECSGEAKSFTITVNQTAVVNAIDNQTLCNGSETSVTFMTPNTGGTMRYTWTNDTPSIGLAASGEGDITSFAAANTGTAPVTATITVTPYFTYNGVECSGEAKSFTITVNPTAVVNAIDNQTLCNGSNTAAVTFGTTN
ncbi:MAG: hypothetical protein PHY65_07845, partial [Bacteroidales bacterium]|nr:hypothetical protein [Bacteroidales bacterium]